MKKIILASASPRRKELLSKAGFKFEVITSDADENIDITDAPLMVRELALLKASAVARRINYDALVIGADTVVSLDGKILAIALIPGKGIHNGLGIIANSLFIVNMKGGRDLPDNFFQLFFGDKRFFHVSSSFLLLLKQLIADGYA